MRRDSKNDGKSAMGQRSVRVFFACFFIFQAAKKVAGGLAANNWLFFLRFESQNWL
jgi:hypothetical protein